MNEITNKPHILLIDGMALLFRSFFATSVFGQFLRNEQGVPTNGVQGFARHVLTAKQMMQPTHMAVCWDMGMHTFRNDLFDGYKSNRPAPPEEMLPQFDMAKDISKMLGWQNFGEIGMEADDLIGSMACKWQNEANITIISGDKDLLQLLSPTTKIAFTKKGYSIYDEYTYERFLEEYQIEPSVFADVKAFMGDSSDGYSGVKGIGPKSALQLIQMYGSVEGVIDAIEELKPAQQKKIQENLDMLRLSKKLATIHCEMDLPIELEELRIPTYSKQHLTSLEEAGFGLTSRHAQSLYSI
ncbi:5'-3' exonuclease H3TH domain-containing protein [Paenisporosarcina quisquiliarum]|uniref:5'-3' exonuclease n=1 Tax=Paenisporosarcina quisquiliarum TaxID=365346 RepID=UPI0037351EDF